MLDWCSQKPWHWIERERLGNYDRYINMIDFDPVLDAF